MNKREIILLFLFQLCLLVPFSLAAKVDHITSTINTPREIALTFDDGPYGTSTEQVLAILKKENVQATFFLIGKNVEKYPITTKEIVSDGNVIGNHSYSHSRNFKEMSVEAFLSDVIKDEDAIASTTGLHPKFFRPPYGIASPLMKKALSINGYTTVMWTVDPEDWKLKNSPQQIEENVLNNVKSNSVILFHDGHETPNYSRQNIVDALPSIIKILKQKGYVFVTVDKLIAKQPYF